MHKLKMVDLHAQYLRIKPEIDEAIQRVLESTEFIKGTEVGEFTQALSRYLAGTHVITCGNGTDALQIAMMALDLRPGDEVVIPAHTYVAPLEVIALLGLSPVFVDVDEVTFNIDVGEAKKKITSRTKAIVPVHLFGQCADMESVLRLAGEHNLFVIEDAAQALGTDYIFSDGTRRKAGTIGTVGITSFFPTKSLGCFGDGGAVMTNDQSLAEKIRMIANHGQQAKYQYEMVGINSRLDTIQAGVLNVKLRYLESYIQRRNDAANYYDQALGQVTAINIPGRSRYSSHCFHQYTLRVQNRDKLVNHLKEYGIPTMIYYALPLHLQKAYRHYGHGEGSLPVTEKLSKAVISLPIHTEMDRVDLERISDAIIRFY